MPVITVNANGMYKCTVRPLTYILNTFNTY